MFTGKGGVGKTTTAAATAVAAAASGVSTLVLSTDAAHSLADALGEPLGGHPRTVAPRLDAQQVSPRSHFADTWQVVHDYLAEALGALGVDPAVAEEMTSLPGAEEIAAVLELRDQVASGRYELVVVDCAPTAETLRLLALPENLAWHLRRVLPGTAGLGRVTRPAAAAALGLPLPGPQIVQIMRQWYDDMVAVHALLASPRTSVRLVMTPESVVIAESRRTWTSLSLYGYAVDAVHVNKILPAPEPGARGAAAHWLRSWNAAQNRGLAEVGESFAGIDIIAAPYLEREPIGPGALADLAARQAPAEGERRPVLDPAPAGGMRVGRTAQGFDLTLALPLTSAREVDLKRRDDDLLLAIGDHRRIVTLPSALRRCHVAGAKVRSGCLTVSFVPDPAQWPKR